MHRAFFAVLRDAHERFILVLLLGEKRRDASLLHLWHPGNQRPVDFARRARAEGFGERRRRKARLGDEQAAGGIFVEPVHQPRPLTLRVAHHPQHAVEMARGAGAALHREPHRLVEHQHVGVFIERDGLEKFPRFVVCRITRCARLGRIEAQRRNADGLAGLEPVLRLGALAIDPHLAFTDDALDVGEAQTRGSAAREKRSTRMPDLSGVTATFVRSSASEPAQQSAFRRREGWGRRVGLRPAG